MSTVTHSMPSGIDVSRLWKLPGIPLEVLLKPIGRIESLCPALRFRMPMGGDEVSKLEVLR